MYYEPPRLNQYTEGASLALAPQSWPRRCSRVILQQQPGLPSGEGAHPIVCLSHARACDVSHSSLTQAGTGGRSLWVERKCESRSLTTSCTMDPEGRPDPLRTAPASPETPLAGPVTIQDANRCGFHVNRREFESCPIGRIECCLQGPLLNRPDRMLARSHHPNCSLQRLGRRPAWSCVHPSPQGIESPAISGRFTRLDLVS